MEVLVWAFPVLGRTVAVLIPQGCQAARRVDNTVWPRDVGACGDPYELSLSALLTVTDHSIGPKCSAQPGSDSGSSWFVSEHSGFPVYT